MRYKWRNLLQKTWCVWQTASPDADGYRQEGQVFAKTWDSKEHALCSLRRHVLLMISWGYHVEALENDVFVVHEDECKNYFYVTNQLYTVSIGANTMDFRTRQEAAIMFGGACFGLEQAGYSNISQATPYDLTMASNGHEVRLSIFRNDNWHQALADEPTRDFYFQR